MIDKNLLGKSSRKIGKRGQVTIFIIIGIVIVFTAFFVGFLQNENFRQRVESSLFGKFVVPEQAQGVVSYLDECIGQITDNGISLLASKAGYIDLPPYISTNPRTYLDVAGLKIPYWVYGENNVNIPSKEEMEFSLKEYLENNFIVSCNLDRFKDQGYVFNNEDPDFDVNINDEEVSVTVSSEVNVGIKESSYSLNDYISINREIPLGSLHKAAINIVQREIRTSPLEFNTLNLISAYSKDKNYMPPIAGFDLDCNGEEWRFEEVRNNVKDVLTLNIPYLRVEGSKNHGNLGDEFYDSMVIDDVPGSFNDISVSFSYFPDWPLFLDIFPRNGNQLKAGGPSINAPLFGLLCTNFYNFRYSLLYPTLIQLEKDEFTFSFPIEVLIKDNYGRRNFFTDIPVDINLLQPERSLFCDEDQKLSGEINLLIRDGLSEQNLENVEVNYICGLNSCGLGKTSNGALIDNFPLCKGGQLRIDKEGYSPYREALDTAVGININKLIELEPYRERNVKVKVMEVNAKNEIIYERDMNENELVNIQFTKINSGLLGYDFQTGISIEGNNLGKVELVPGEYTLDAQLQLNDKITLPKQEINGNLFDGGEVENPYLGGAKIDNLFIDKKVLDNSQELTVFVVSYGIPKTIDDLGRGFNFNEFNIQPALK